MPSALKDIKFVDLKRSTWDEKKSNRKKGEYVFQNKVYYRNSDFTKGYVHPYKLRWSKYAKTEYPRPFASWEKDQIVFKATFITTKDDYWPEGLIPDAETRKAGIDVPKEVIDAEVNRAADDFEICM